MNVERSVEWELTGKADVLGERKPAPVPLCPPQIPHDLTWAQTRAAAVGSRRLTACTMAQPYVIISTRYLESHVQLADRHECWKFASGAENLVCRHCWFSCQLSIDSQPVKRRSWGWCEMIASLGVVSWQEFCTGGYDRRTWVREAEESPTLEAVARKRLVETSRLRTLVCVCVSDL
jgi:hypothetical protein